MEGVVGNPDSLLTLGVVTDTAPVLATGTDANAIT